MVPEEVLQIEMVAEVVLSIPEEVLQIEMVPEEVLQIEVVLSIPEEVLQIEMVRLRWYLSSTLNTWGSTPDW